MYQRDTQVFLLQLVQALKQLAVALDTLCAVKGGTDSAIGILLVGGAGEFVQAQNELILALVASHVVVFVKEEGETVLDLFGEGRTLREGLVEEVPAGAFFALPLDSVGFAEFDFGMHRHALLHLLLVVLLENEVLAALDASAIQILQAVVDEDFLAFVVRGQEVVFQDVAKDAFVLGTRETSLLALRLNSETKQKEG